VGVLFLIVFVGLLGFGIILPLFPFYAERLGASPEIITWTMSGYTLGQFVVTPVWGRVSDALGRRPVLIMTMLGSAVAYVVLAYADELWIVIASRVFGGMMAGNIAAAFAYVTDITSEKQRAAGLGRVSAALGLGFMFGPAFGGLLAGGDVDTANYVMPALAAAGLSLLAMLGAMIFLPESLAPEHRKPLFGSRRAKAPSPDDGVGRSVVMTLLLMLIAVAFVFYTAMSLMESIFALWANDSFDMGPRSIGWIFLLLGTMNVLVQGVLIGKLTERFSEKQLAIAAAVLFGVGMAILAEATAYWHILAGIISFGIGTGLFNPTISSMVSKTAAENERGFVMGKYQAASALGRVVGPAVSGVLYAQVSMAAPFGVGALLMVPVVMLIGRFRVPEIGPAHADEPAVSTDNERDD